MQNFDKLLYTYENNPSTFAKLSKKELQKRADKINQLKTQVDTLSAEYAAVSGNNVVQQPSYDSDLER